MSRLTVDTSTLVEFSLDDRENMLSKRVARSVRIAARVSVDELVDSLTIVVGFRADEGGVAVGRFIDEFDVRTWSGR
jgi:hypothetical protein